MVDWRRRIKKLEQRWRGNRSGASGTKPVKPPPIEDGCYGGKNSLVHRPLPPGSTAQQSSDYYLALIKEPLSAAYKKELAESRAQAALLPPISAEEARREYMKIMRPNLLEMEESK